jgi:hypothetical protein
MQFTSTALLFILAMTSVAVTSVSAEDAKIGGLRGGPSEVAGEESPVSKVNRLLSEDMVVDFKRGMGLKKDFELSMQEIDSGEGSFEANGRVYSLSGLTPYNVYADGVDSMLVDGEVIPLMNHTTTFLGEDLDGGTTFLVVKGTKGEVRDIDFVNADGSVTQITEVAAGIYATVPPDAYDLEADSSVFLGGDYTKDPKGLVPPSGRTLLEAPATNATRQDERSLQASCSSFRNLEVAIAFDSSFCARFGGYNRAREEVERIVTTASTSWYRRPGLCVNVLINRLEGHCDSGSDPYNRGAIASGCDGAGMLQFFRNYWNQNRRTIPRDAAHLFRSSPFTNAPFIGCATIGALCDTESYGVNDFSQTQMSSTLRRAVLFAHELGHNAGASELGNFEGVNYIMEMTVDHPGNNGFSQTSKTSILNYINSGINCIGTVPAATPYYFYSAHSTYLGARDNGGVKLLPRAREWERWTVVSTGSGRIALQSFHGNYLSARSDGRIGLAPYALEWEEWTVVHIGDGSVAFRSWRGTYLSARPDGSVRQMNNNQVWEHWRAYT